MMAIKNYPLKKGTVFWFTGLAGAGKTTIAKQFYIENKSKNPNTVFLDGDILREIFDETTHQYSAAHRLKIAYRNAKLCKLLADQGVNVICATISLFHEIQQWNRQHNENYHEIFIRASMDILAQRNKKNLYSRPGNNRLNNIVGIDINPEFPQNPDIILDNNGQRSVDNILEELIETLTNYPSLGDTTHGK